MMSPPSPPHSLVQANTPHPSVEWLSCEQESVCFQTNLCWIQGNLQGRSPLCIVRRLFHAVVLSLLLLSGFVFF